MNQDVVTYESNDGVALITINRPDKLNALNGAVVAGLIESFQRLAAGDDRAAVLTGAGERAFSVGADIKDPPRDPELFECVPGVGVELDKPVIAAVTGHCVGGAYILVQACDLAVASSTADFFYPEAQLGFCGGLIASCAARIPHKVAMEFMLTGEHFNAQRAREVGMVNKVVPEGEHVEAAMSYAQKLARSAPLVVGMLKRFTRDTVMPKGPAELAGLARRELLRVNRSEDRNEGAQAFVEKRQPEFKGQ